MALVFVHIFISSYPGPFENTCFCPANSITHATHSTLLIPTRFVTTWPWWAQCTRSDDLWRHLTSKARDRWRNICLTQSGGLVVERVEEKGWLPGCFAVCLLFSSPRRFYERQETLLIVAAAKRRRGGWWSAWSRADFMQEFRLRLFKAEMLEAYFPTRAVQDMVDQCSL